MTSDTENMIYWMDRAHAAEAALATAKAESLEEAASYCDNVAAHWATFHSVAPSAAHQCASVIRDAIVPPAPASLPPAPTAAFREDEYGAPAAPEPPRWTRWEYTTCTIGNLADFGAEGWEAYAVRYADNGREQGIVAYLKRHALTLPAGGEQP
jgi:hypothetical protein